MFESSVNIDNLKSKTELGLNLVKMLPPSTKVMTEVLSLFYNDTATRHKLSDLINKDQSLTSRILAVANSSFYGLYKSVTTVDHAILIIGFKELEYIVSAFSLIDSLKFKSDEYLNQNSFWKHSFSTGIIAKRISEERKLDNTSEVFTAGFLHDIGYSILQHFFKDEFIRVHKMVKNRGLSFIEAENIVLGMDHEVIGAKLMEKWNFPDSYADSTLFHHSPIYSDKYPELTSVVHLADYISQQLLNVRFEPDKDFHFEKGVSDVLHFGSEEIMEEYITRIKEEMITEINSLKI